MGHLGNGSLGCDRMWRQGCPSFAVWVLRSDGNVSGAILDPNASPRFVPLVASNGMPFDPRGHYEGGLALRCVRVTDLSP